MTNKILIITICALLFLSCKSENNSNKNIPLKTESEPIKKEKKPETKSILYKEKASPEILNIISRYEYIKSVKWKTNQIYEMKGITNPNENIKAFLLNGELGKIEVTENKNGRTRISELYADNNYLSLVIEKEMNSLESKTESHFYFKKNKLLKKVINNLYEKTVSERDLTDEEKRLKKKFDNYAGQIMIDIQKSFAN